MESRSACPTLSRAALSPTSYHRQWDASKRTNPPPSWAELSRIADTISLMTADLALRVAAFV
jgi:hypothetical protein